MFQISASTIEKINVKLKAHKEVIALNIALSMLMLAGVTIAYLIALYLQKPVSFTTVLFIGILAQLGINFIFIFLIFVAKTLDSLIKD